MVQIVLRNIERLSPCREFACLLTIWLWIPISGWVSCFCCNISASLAEKTHTQTLENTMRFNSFNSLSWHTTKVILFHWFWPCYLCFLAAADKPSPLLLPLFMSLCCLAFFWRASSPYRTQCSNLQNVILLVGNVLLWGLSTCQAVMFYTIKLLNRLNRYMKV